MTAKQAANLQAVQNTGWRTDAIITGMQISHSSALSGSHTWHCQLCDTKGIHMPSSLEKPAVAIPGCFTLGTWANLDELQINLY